MKNTLDTKVLPEKQKSQIQAEQVVKIRPKLGRGRAGIRCKTPQSIVVDTNATVSKSCKIPTVQNVTKIPSTQAINYKQDRNNYPKKDTR